MRIAIFSDIHGNLPALETFVEQTRTEVDAYLCLGDIVNYGPWNDECLEMIFALPGIVVLEGNHERLFLGTEQIGHEIVLVQEFYRSSIQRFTRRDLIANLPPEYKIGGFVCTHTIGGRNIYRDTQIEIDRSYIIGHSHHAFDIERSGHRIVNCGSIGQNRKRLDKLNYAVLDAESGEISLEQRDYPYDRLLQEMRRLEYPQICLDYYMSKLPK